MSAPDTNVEKQERNHKPALLGIKGVLIVVALLAIAAIFYTSISRSESGAQDVPVAPAATTEQSSVTTDPETVAPAPASEPGTNQSATTTTD
tara:strand:+ start:555 stop:830 length:276 start_codon:yes stop_codon:yes gene_type:complete